MARHNARSVPAITAVELMFQQLDKIYADEFGVLLRRIEAEWNEAGGEAPPSKRTRARDGIIGCYESAYARVTEARDLVYDSLKKLGRALDDLAMAAQKSRLESETSYIEDEDQCAARSRALRR